MDDIPLVSGVTLREVAVEAGRRLVDALRHDDFAPTAACWLYDGDVRRWRLILASRIYDELGARAAYDRLNRVRNALELPRVAPEHILLYSHEDPLIRGMSELFPFLQETEDSLFEDFTLGLETIDAAYCYALGAPKS